MNTFAIVSGWPAFPRSLPVATALALALIGGVRETRAQSAKAAPTRRTTGDYETTMATVTIAGRALDPDGNPVADAVVQVVNNNGRFSGDRLLGKTTSGADGRFTFRAISIPVLSPPPSAVPKPVEGRFEVSGWAAGRAFAWHADQSYRPGPRPTEAAPGDAGRVFYRGETITADLVFGPAARIRGTITDDAGRPVAGALVQVGHINDTRKPGGSGIWNCTAIGPDSGEDLRFSGVSLLPESLRSARTDAAGKYEIGGLPREARLLALIDHEPAYDPHTLTIATSLKPLQGVVSLGYDGSLDHTFVVPRTVRVRAVSAATGRPAAGATAIARGPTIRRAGAMAVADADGIAVLRLTPDEYRLRVEPPATLGAVPAERPLAVTKATAEARVDVALEPGAVVVFEAVDDATGKPVAGVRFEYETDATKVRRPVSSQAVYVDHPATGPDGRLTVVMAPGARRFLPVPVLGTIPVQDQSRLLTLASGKSEVVQFSFATPEAPRPGPAQAPAPADKRVGRLQELWQRQKSVSSRGRLRGTRTYQSGAGIDPERLARWLDSLDRDRVPSLVEGIRETFPDAEPAFEGNVELTFDEPKRRQDRPGSRGELTVFNGVESIQYSAANGQVDVYDPGRGEGFAVGVAGLDDFVRLGQQDGTIVDQAHGTVTLERKVGAATSRRVADAATGFVYRDSDRRGETWDEYWGFAPRPTPEGLVVPGLSVVMRAYQGRVNAIWIRRVESVELAAVIPPERFVVAVPAGCLLLDYRHGRDDAYRGVLAAPVTDILTRADEIAATRTQFVPPVKPGDPAPAIAPVAWLDQSGEIEAPDLRGKVVLVDFWGITCGFCVAQLPEVRAAAEHFKGTDLRIIGLHDSSGTVDEVARFAAKREIPYALAIDREAKAPGWFGQAFADYGVRGIPGAAVIDRRGKVVFVGRFEEALEKAAAVLKVK